uniref:NAC domain-containing protein n=1 Tax=Vitis vinifera TaxID=29760 RepID=A5C6B9_VITVI|nr:hypothetical protein VITISV_000508 [Vitis vinifera]
MKIQLSLSLSLALALTYLFFCKYAENSRTVTDKEWYFFCRRGRKYRNSVRPNRVTGSGFWKATGIDKPIYSVEEGHSRGDCIGLKKSLVYYCGSAGKGTKTDWMMHEFRLPADQKNATLPTAKAADQEAEVWTLCRIFTRNVPHRRYTPDWREVPAKRNPTNSKPETCDMSPENWEGYVSSGAPVSLHKGKKPVGSHIDEGNPLPAGQVSSIVQGSQPESCSSSILSNDAREFFAHGNWDEIVSFMELSFDPSSINNFKIMH